MLRAHAPLDGAFASDRFHRRERWWQRAGLAALAVLAAGSAAGLYAQPTTVARTAIVYGFLMIVFRLAGRRTLAQVTTFDLILVLIIGDSTQQAIIGDDFTIATAIVAISTLILLDVIFAKAKDSWRTLDAVADGLPLVLVDHGRPHPERMEAEGVSIDDVLTAARERHGLTRLEDIEFAVLERTGGISIVPRPSAKTRSHG